MAHGRIRGGWLIAAWLALSPFGSALAQQNVASHATEMRVADGLLARQGNASNFAPVQFQPSGLPSFLSRRIKSLYSDEVSEPPFWADLSDQ